MSATFTPGPWTPAKTNMGYTNIVVGKFFYTPRWTGVAQPSEAEANARLIATAPELYQKLADVAERGDNYDANDWAAFVQEAADLCAKVRGEQVPA